MDELLDRPVRKGNYVHGSFIKPEAVDGYINCINPADRADVLGRFPFSEAAVDDAVAHARAAAPGWRRTGLNERAALLSRFRDQLARHADALAGWIHRETGKPTWESAQEVRAAQRRLDQLLDQGVALLAPVVLEDGLGRADRVPWGVVAIPAPYSQPVEVAVQLLAAALLAGNTVVLKPSKFTPVAGQALLELLDRCRLPRGVVNMVQGSGSVVGQRLVTHPGVDAVLVTCSFPTAAAIRRLTFERPEVPLLLQTGGKGIALVLDDADLDRAVYEVVVGAFLTAGQRHSSTARVVVTDGVFDAFLERLVDRTRRLRVGPGDAPDTFMGPLISENLRTRYRRYLRALKRRGHSAVVGGGPLEVPGRRGFFVSPAVHLVDAASDHPFLNEEPPGPILLVYRVPDAEAAVELHNRALYRRVCSVFTAADGPALARIVDGLRTGAVNVNRSTLASSLRLPARAVGRASNGAPEGVAIVRALTWPRAWTVDRRPFDPAVTLPGTGYAPAPAGDDDGDDIELPEAEEEARDAAGSTGGA